MEPMTLTATAIATLILIKVCEGAATKTGEKVVEKASELVSPQLKEKASKLRSLLHIKLPNTAKAIEQAPQPPLDMGKAELELKKATENDGELAQAVQEVDAVVKADPKLTQAVEELADELESQPLDSQSYTNIIGKVINLSQGRGGIHIGEQNIHL